MRVCVTLSLVNMTVHVCTFQIASFLLLSHFQDLIHPLPPSRSSIVEAIICFVGKERQHELFSLPRRKSSYNLLAKWYYYYYY